jgi:hypothetical protein
VTGLAGAIFVSLAFSIDYRVAKYLHYIGAGKKSMDSYAQLWGG